MKYLLIACLLFTATIAHAQTVELTIKASPAEAELIWKGLRKLPVEDVEVIMSKIRQQITEQTTPKPIEVPKKDK